MRLLFPLLVSATPALAAAMWSGAPLRLAPCASSPSQVVVFSRSDSTMRSPDGALCATYLAPSPAQLQMQPCAAGATNQVWGLNASTGAVEGAPAGTSGCLAWNTQGDETTPARPVSTWTCSDIEWNGLFHIDAAGRVVANCSGPGSCSADAAPYCVAAEAGLGRVLSLATVVRYWTVETTRNTHLLNNESALHTVAACEAFRAAVAAGWPGATVSWAFRAAVAAGWPGATVSWAFSWVALTTDEAEYPAIRALVAGYVASYGDEFTFVPGGYFAPMYNAEATTNTDIHDALALITSTVGGGYRPKAIVAGYLGAQTLAYLAQVEGIHVAQATIFSQFNIDFGDGDGGSPYPYYPATQHYLKPAQGTGDFVDIVALDGWTVDFLAARRNGFADGFNSRMGVGPIETIAEFGPLVGAAEQMHATAQHFDAGFALNGEAFVTSIWEISLSINVTYMTAWLAAVRAQWPDAQLITHGEFGSRWRAVHNGSNDYNYSFVEIGSGIGGSDADKEITLFVNRAFRLALLRNLTDEGAGAVIDFTRYDLAAQEPTTVPDRSWNLMNEINMKQSRGAVDAPRPLSALSQADRDIIHGWLPGLPVA